MSPLMLGTIHGLLCHNIIHTPHLTLTQSNTMKKHLLTPLLAIYIGNMGSIQHKGEIVEAATKQSGYQLKALTKEGWVSYAIHGISN